MNIVTKGIVLEGGAMRGLFSAGVTDVLTERNLLPDAIVGVSAGACFGCNIKSRQPGRALRYNMRFAHDPRYCSILSLIRDGNIYNARFTYHVVPNNYDIFDSETFLNSPIQYYVVCTDVVTGKPVYKLCDMGGDSLFEWIRASASMPIVSTIVEIDNLKLLDGGMTDSIPLEFFERKGINRNVVILTQPEGYIKKPTHIIPLMKLKYKRYPNLITAMAQRHIMYNRQLDYIKQAETEGRCIVIRPETALSIGHISHSPAEMFATYMHGRSVALKLVDKIKNFWK